MASPQLNEAMIAATLGAPPMQESGEPLRTAAFLTIVDAYDRKVDRDTFFETAQAACQLSEMMGRLESITGISNSFKAEKLTIDKLEDALATVTGHAEVFRMTLIRKIGLMMQMPWDDDTKH